MTLNILQRMLLKELTKVFLLSLVTLTGLFLLAGLVHEASQRGLSPGKILAIIPLLVPNTLPYTIPATTLFATSVVYGRLAHDNEYTAVKAAGVNPMMLLKPAILLGLTASSVTMSLYYDLIPRTQRMLREHILSDTEEVAYTLLKREKRMKFNNFPFVMYVREVQGRRLNDVIFKRWTDPKQQYLGYDFIARAREAKLTIDKEKGIGYIDMDNCVVYGESQSLKGNLRPRTFEFPLPEELTGKQGQDRPMALTWEELRQHKVMALGEWAELTEKYLAARQELADLPEDSPRKDELTLHVNQLDYQANRHAVRKYFSLETEMQMRPALAFGCVCFVLIGAPVGIWFSRSDYLSSFVSCFLPVICVYYPLVLSGSNLAREGKVPMLPAVWAANGVLLVAASFLIVKLVRR